MKIKSSSSIRSPRKKKSLVNYGKKDNSFILITKPKKRKITLLSLYLAFYKDWYLYTMIILSVLIIALSIYLLLVTYYNGNGGNPQQTETPQTTGRTENSTTGGPNDSQGEGGTGNNNSQGGGDSTTDNDSTGGPENSTTDNDSTGGPDNSTTGGPEQTNSETFKVKKEGRTLGRTILEMLKALADNYGDNADLFGNPY
jgi:hypothetical protein